MVTLRCTGKLLKRLGATPQTALITGATDAGCAALHRFGVMSFTVGKYVLNLATSRVRIGRPRTAACVHR